METPTLLAYFANERLGPIVVRGWFSRPSVRLGPFMWRAYDLFEMGVVLGWGFRERLPAFVELIVQPGHEEATLAGLKASASLLKTQVRAEWQSVFDVFFAPEAERLIKSLREAKRTRASGFPEFARATRVKLSFDEALFHAQDFLRQGIALGGGEPELAARLLQGRPNPETWRIARAGDRRLPAIAPEPKSLALRQEESVGLIRAFVEAERPDALARLGLWPEAEIDFRLRWRALRSRHPSSGE